MKINSNSTAVITGNYLLRAENALSKSTERLSSGYKINNASDNPAGYAISSKMRAQIKSLEKAANNADDAVNFIRTGEGALTEIQSMVQRMNELSVQAANGTQTTADREAIQDEIDQLSDEIERMARTVEFNDQPIINGNYEYRGYTYNVDGSGEKLDTPTGINVLSYSDETKTGEFILNIGGTADAPTVTSTPDLATGLEASFDSDRNILTMKANDGTEVLLEMPDGYTAGEVMLDLTGIGAMRIQVGANEGQVLEMSIPEISLKKMDIEKLDVTTQEGAKEAIGKVDKALDYVSAARSKFGAYENRLEHIVSSLDITTESLEGSYATLADTDMAAEMTEYTKLNVLQQAATSMLAQANQFPQQALQLLQ